MLASANICVGVCIEHVVSYSLSTFCLHGVLEANTVCDGICDPSPPNEA